MKTLIFFRHGKSDWNAAFEHDHDRPINKRGRTDAKRMGRFLAEINFLPDRIISSSAVRARTTMDQAREEGGWGHIPTEVTNRLYEASPEQVLDVIRAQEEDYSRLLLVGHEPTWSTMVGRLVGEAGVRVATGTMVRVDVRAPRWSDVGFGRGELRWLVPPKLLRNTAE